MKVTVKLIAPLNVLLLAPVLACAGVEHFTPHQRAILGAKSPPPVEGGGSGTPQPAAASASASEARRR